MFLGRCKLYPTKFFVYSSYRTGDTSCLNSEVTVKISNIFNGNSTVQTRIVFEQWSYREDSEHF